MAKEKLKSIGIFENYRIRHHGLFDYRETYNSIINWFSKYKYDFFEKQHDEKDNPAGKEIRVKWAGIRKVTDYVMFEAEVDMYIRNMFPVEVETNGKKQGKSQGRLEVTINTKMNKDWDKKFKQGKFGEVLRQFYERYIIRNKLLFYEDKIYLETVDLIDTIKSAMK